jgi:hypothetical protein
MKSLRMSRRDLLRALGGTAIALPMLEIFDERNAYAAAAPLRFLIMFAGVSQGNDGYTASGGEPNFLKPASLGAAYQLPKRHSLLTQAVDSPLQPLITHGVKDNVAVISGLEIPRATGTTATPPPAGMAGGLAWHASSMSPLLSGMRSKAGFPAGDVGFADNDPQGDTAELLAADAIGKGTVFPSLNYRVHGAGTRGKFSWRNEVPRDSVQSPHDAFLTLNGQVKSTDSAAQAQLKAEAARKNSILEMVTMKSRIVKQLGKVDQGRLALHFEQLAAYQRTLESSGSATCTSPTDPSDTGQAGSELGRAELFAEVIKFGFQCDLSRSALLGVTAAQSYLRLPLWDNQEAHEVLHTAGQGVNTAKVLGFHVNAFANLVKVLKKTTDFDGKTLLDNTAIVYVFEGGADTKAQVTHSSENMVVFAAGRAAGKLAGHHISTDRKHPGSVVLSALRNVGVTGAYGEVTDPLAATLL